MPLYLFIIIAYAISMVISCPTPVGIFYFWTYPLGIFEAINIDLLPFIPKSELKHISYFILGYSIQALFILALYKSQKGKFHTYIKCVFIALLILNTYGCQKIVGSVGR
jgi:hypothetical protein